MLALGNSPNGFSGHPLLVAQGSPTCCRDALARLLVATLRPQALDHMFIKEIVDDTPLSFFLNGRKKEMFPGVVLVNHTVSFEIHSSPFSLLSDPVLVINRSYLLLSI